MAWFKTEAEKKEKAALKRIEILRGYQEDIKKKGPAAMDIESIKSDYDRYTDEIKKIQRDNPNSNAIQEAKNIYKFLLRETNKNKTSGNNTVLAGIQKKYVAGGGGGGGVTVKKTTNNSSPTQMDRNKFSNKTKTLKSKTFANNSSPTQMDRNKFSNKTKSLKSKTFANNSSPTQMDKNKTKSLKSKTFASKQKAFNKKYRA